MWTQSDIDGRNLNKEYFRKRLFEKTFINPEFKPNYNKRDKNRHNGHKVDFPFEVEGNCSVF